MIIDLHCHSNCSDGELSPIQLIELAEKNHVEMFAITDHDTITAYNEIKNYQTKIKIISGVEFSTIWNKIGIHIIGLNFNLNSEMIKEAVEFQQQTRLLRAQIISEKLVKIGLPNAYERLLKQSPSKQIGRPDFARLLVEQGLCKDFKHAFKKYLGAGKIGDVKNEWLSLPEIIQSITQAGGVAVIAHPLYYNMTNTKLKRLIVDFKKQGGCAMEVINGYQNPDKTHYLQQLCQKYNLESSIGSDFHRQTSFSKLGMNTELLRCSQFVISLLKAD